MQSGQQKLHQNFEQQIPDNVRAQQQAANEATDISADQIIYSILARFSSDQFTAHSLDQEKRDQEEEARISRNNFGFISYNIYDQSISISSQEFFEPEIQLLEKKKKKKLIKKTHLPKSRQRYRTIAFPNHCFHDIQQWK